MTKHELASKVEELKELKAMAEELSAEMTAIEDAIKAEMAARDTEELQAGLFKVRYKTIESRRLDGKSLKAEMPELYDRFSKPIITRRFVIA